MTNFKLEEKNVTALNSVCLRQYRTVVGCVQVRAGQCSASILTAQPASQPIIAHHTQATVPVELTKMFNQRTPSFVDCRLGIE